MIFFLLQLSLSWWDTGHSIIARIAQKEITSAQNQWITDLFYLWPEEAGDLINQSSWQDIIANLQYQVRSMKTWHYADEPYIPEDSPEIRVPPICYNVTDICRDTMELLLDKTTTSPWALSFALRSLIHFLGDSHCPMHAVALFTKDLPTGDAGGNLYKFTNELGANAAQLHKIWDNAGLSYQTLYPKSTFEANVSRLIKNHPKSLYEKRIQETNPYTWILESFQVAKEVAYSTPQGQTPSEDYFQRVREAADTQLAIAGYRLGAFLNKFFEKRGLPELYTPFSKQEKKIKISEVVAWILVALCVVYLGCERLFSILKRHNIVIPKGKTDQILKDDNELDDQ
ncbi:class I nuclease [Tritrichomonas foetus]|uniref:Class I nuclease n=1 Tax=Tritrichomonas foetus TaxID=1144522 RepID=A0A1J4JZX1_9EUKA|nr:class I nuclease [Tritrichomonas foetus]|eukprot:OHT02805.1 class I nuclease [Tritrichomonas foetus]